MRKQKLKRKYLTVLKWDCPDKGGKGGTTTDGNCARKLLHTHGELIINELPEHYKDIFRHFGQHLSVIIRMSSKEKVDMEMYKQFCTNLYLFLIESF